MSEVERADGCYLGGVVAGNRAALTGVLGVAAELIESPAAQSVELVRRAAEACRAKFAADYGLAVGPFPQVDPETADPEPFHVALATAEGTELRSYPFAGHPELLKVLSAKRALNVVRLAMLAGAGTGNG
jgi:nicotinamide mononucleotide (NMN) deamidase PncC